MAVPTGYTAFNIEDLRPRNFDVEGSGGIQVHRVWYVHMTAYGRKQTFGLSLNPLLRMSALEKKADARKDSLGDASPNVR